MVLGRHPNCQIVLDNVAVSRQHAQILEGHGTFYLEDLRSRNGTQLNGTPVQGRTELQDEDEIRVCDFVFRFHLTAPSLDELRERPTATYPATIAQSPNLRAALAQTAELDADQSSIISRLDAGSASSLRLDVKPEAKLRAVMEISTTLGKVLQLEEVLPRILQSLFSIFPQADQGFVLLRDAESDALNVSASRNRSPAVDDAVPISMTIVRQTMDAGQAILSADVVGDQRFDQSESVAQMQLRSLMCVPLVGPSGTPLGVIQLSTQDANRHFMTEDLDLLSSVAVQAALAIENATAHETLLRQRDLERELEFATQVQLGFLPKDRPRIEGYEFADYYEAAHRIGGDYFDYVPLPNGDIAIALGDVAGKGVPAALLMARLYSVARFHLLTATGAGQALSGLNHELALSGLGHRFISLVLMILNPHTHVVTLVNAGHLPPMLRGTDGKVTNFGAKESGMPLGIVPEQQFQEVSRTLAPGDALVLYTDGITEAMDARNELYGRRRLSRYLTHDVADAEGLVDGLIADVNEFSGDQPQRDDICVVAVRRTP
jgi:serine phosphatase RsbU (regulator of sigma subunit)